MGIIKDLDHPVWEQMVDNWLGHIPVGLAPPGPSVVELLSLAGVSLKDKENYSAVAGVRERTFADAIFLRDKARYCFACAPQANSAGFSTWTALSMYDASFFAAKALIYLMGIRDVGRDSKFYLQLFKSEFKKGRLLFDGHSALLLKDRLTHDSLWSLFSRVLGTIRGADEVVAIAKDFGKNDFEKFTRERNNLVYGSSSWSREESIKTSDLYFPKEYPDNTQYFTGSGAERAEFVDKYYRTAHVALNIVDGFLSAVGVYAPAVSSHLQAYPGPPPVHGLRF